MLKHPTGRIARIRITPRLLELLDRHNVHTDQRSRKRWKLGDQLMVNRDARIEPYSHILYGMVIPSAMGAFSYTCSSIEPTLRIGRYCSIAHSVSQMGQGHPTDWVTTSPFSHNPQPMGGFADYLVNAGVKKFDLHPFDQGRASIEIGNDVWICEGALLKPGIRIGHGAIVAARAIVTRDVPPYAIVGGSPARILRYRFAEDLIERLQALQWWNYGPDMLQPLDVRDPEGFADRFEQAITDGARPLDLPVLTGEEIIAAGEPVG